MLAVFIKYILYMFMQSAKLDASKVALANHMKQIWLKIMENMMKYVLASALVPLGSVSLAAETKELDTDALASKTVHGVAKLTPLALSDEGKPAAVLLNLSAGQVVPPHDAKAPMSLITVVSGTLYWGDGDTVVEGAERIYLQGSVLAMPGGVMHWLAARDGDLKLQVVFLDDETVAPSVQQQLD